MKPTATRRVAKLFAATLGLGLVAAAAPALADPYCLPVGNGVPGASGVPAWWGASTSIGVDDPRWRGAAMFNHLGDAVRFQSVVDNSAADPYLVMSWQVKADSGADDVLYFGFYRDGGTPATSDGNVFRITRKQATATPVGGVGSNSTTTELEAFYWNNGAATPAWSVASGLPTFPTWISDDVRIDVTCTGPVCDTWAIRLRVKIVGAGQGDFASPSTAAGGGIELPTGFKFWYELKTDLTLGLASPSSSLEFNPTVTAADPDLLDPDNFADESALGGPRFPATSKWFDVSLDTADPTCIKGINIKSGDIYVVNSVTGAAGGNQMSLLGANTFHARPTNNTGGAIPLAGAAIRARFRIADWNTSSHASAIWREVPGCAAATGSGTVANGTQFDLTCAMTPLTPAEQCEYAVPPAMSPAHCAGVTPTRDDHQCILVDLSTAASQFYFSSVSTYRNHNFVGASEYRKKVRIDVNGLPPPAGGEPNRDVYVYIQTRNMPSKIEPAQVDPQADPQDGQDGAAAAPRDLLRRLKLPDNGRIDSAAASRVQAALAAGQITWGEVEQIMPSHVAYVWHDTGKTISLNGGTRKLLRPQGSFGYFVSHDGELTGWENELEGATVSKIAPNFYKVSVPTDGFVNAETVIRSLEPKAAVDPDPVVDPSIPTPPPGTPWWAWLLVILIGVLVIVFLLRNRP